MKTISTQLSHFFENTEIKRNLPLFLKFLGVLMGVIFIFTVLFHFIMLYEGQQHSWITGLYWTLTVMSTLGFGDITFTTDLGRLFSVVVLVTGIVMVLIVLPFAFIRFFYAPWLKSQIEHSAPRSVPPTTRDHVIITDHNPFTSELAPALDREDIAYTLLESDPETASRMQAEGWQIMVGDVSDEHTYEHARAPHARLLVANGTDVDNTSSVLTSLEVAPELPIAAVANRERSIDMLEMNGTDHVLPLKQWLGRQFVNRIMASRVGLQSFTSYGDLEIAELPVRHTPLVGQTIRETKLREEFGLNVIGVWEHGPLVRAHPSKTLTESSVLVVIGTEKQLEQLGDAFVTEKTGDEPVVIIGGGTVGRAAARELKDKGVAFNLIEHDRERCEQLRKSFDGIYEGDASDYPIVHEAGIMEAPAVLLTTDNDAMNVHLASYCQNLNTDLRIVSRINHQRNLDVIYRAGADFVLSHTTLGINAITSILKDKELLVLGESVDFFAREVPASLRGQTLAESGIGEQTGLTVVALQRDEHTTSNVSPSVELMDDMELLMVGSDEQLDAFIDHYE